MKYSCVVVSSNRVTGALEDFRVPDRPAAIQNGAHVRESGRRAPGTSACPFKHWVRWRRIRFFSLSFRLRLHSGRRQRRAILRTGLYFARSKLHIPVVPKPPIIAVMMLELLRWFGIVTLLCSMGMAQSGSSPTPDHLLVARHTFFDFGPPNDFYELIQVEARGNGLLVQRVLVTPPGSACVQPAKVEYESGTLNETMDALLESRNPCQIPEKELHRERVRCKKCLAFSGVDITM